MTPAEKNIVRSLIAVAWVDGRLESGEASVIEGLLSGFDATEDEERELLEYGKTRRTLEEDVPVADLTTEDRELLLSNAALLTHADGEQSGSERALLAKLARILEFTTDQANEILKSVGDGALRLSSRALAPDDG